MKLSPKLDKLQILKSQKVNEIIPWYKLSFKIILHLLIALNPSSRALKGRLSLE